MRGSQREYARHRGVSHVAVGKAVKTGRISLGADGKIDFAQADAQWAGNTNPVMAALTDSGAKTRKAPATQAKAKPTQDRDPVAAHPPLPPPIDSGGVSMMKAQTMKAVFAAQREKLRFEEESGKKIDADDVRVRAFNRARRARDMLMSAPTRIAPLLVGLDVFGITIALEEELRRVAEEISSDATAPI